MNYFFRQENHYKGRCHLDIDIVCSSLLNSIFGYFPLLSYKLFMPTASLSICFLNDLPVLFPVDFTDPSGTGMCCPHVLLSRLEGCELFTNICLRLFLLSAQLTEMLCTVDSRGQNRGLRHDLYLLEGELEYCKVGRSWHCHSGGSRTSCHFYIFVLCFWKKKKKKKELVPLTQKSVLLVIDNSVLSFCLPFSERFLSIISPHYLSTMHF